MDIENKNKKAEDISKDSSDKLINLLLSQDSLEFLSDFYINAFNTNKKYITGLTVSDFDIILSSYDAEKKELLHSFRICNSKFDPKTPPSRKLTKEDDSQEIRNAFLNDERKKTIFKSFPDVKLELEPRIRRNLIFDVAQLNYKIVKDGKVVDYTMEHKDNNPDKKDILVVVSLKNLLDGKKHKLGKYTQMLEQYNQFKEFWNSHRITYFIFCVKDEEQILKEYEIFPDVVKQTNENYDFVRLIFYIDPKGDDETEPMNIFENSDYGKNYYFHLTPDNKIYRADDMLCSGDIIENTIKRKKYEKDLEKTNKDKSPQQLVKERNEAFTTFYTFLKNIKDYKYALFVGFDFEVCLKMNKDLDFYVSYIYCSNITAELRTKEHLMIKKCADILQPDNNEVEEIPTIDIDIDFNNMDCFRCRKKIEDQDLYYCYKCKVKYCRDCVNSNYIQNKGKGKFIDPNHNLLYFSTRDTDRFKNIDLHKLGKDAFAQCTNESKLRAHSAICNGCGGHFEDSPRYLCLHCRPGKAHSDGYFDFCKDCIYEMRKENNPQGNVIEKRVEYKVYSDETRLLLDEKDIAYHSHKDHIYLMLALEVENGEQSYYEF